MSAVDFVSGLMAQGRYTFTVDVIANLLKISLTAEPCRPYTEAYIECSCPFFLQNFFY